MRISNYNTNCTRTQDELLRYETDEPFVQTLLVNLEGLLQGFKGSLTTSNYDALIGLLTAEVTARLEKVVLKSTFNRVRISKLSSVLNSSNLLCYL